jgi:hypothetical protein
MTKYIKKLLTLPMPLRVGAMTFAGVFLIFIGLGSFKERAVVALSFGLLGVAGFVLGMILATDYRGSASAYAGLWSVEAGRSWLRIYIRALGAGFMVVGVVFVAVSVLSAFARTP